MYNVRKLDLSSTIAKCYLIYCKRYTPLDKFYDQKQNEEIQAFYRRLCLLFLYNRIVMSEQKRISWNLPKMNTILPG